MPESPGLKEFWRRLEPDFRRIFLLSSVLLLLVKISLTDQAILDPDLGWHLKTGEWIRTHGTVPLTDPFSQFGAHRSWVAYSWLFEWILSSLESVFGLPGVIGLTLILSVAIFAALFLLLRQVNSEPGVVMALLALGVIAMSPLLRTPRPWLFTTLFFIIELILIQRARLSGRFRVLWGLPILFLLWANAHIQFIYGFFPLGLLLLDRMSPSQGSAEFTFRRWALLISACFLVTLINPYGLQLYVTLWEVIRQTGPYELISEMQAMSFRHPADWVALILTVGAAYALGKNPQKDRLLTVFFLVGLLVAYRSRRDIWFVVIPSLYLLARWTGKVTVPRGGLFTPVQWRGALLIALIFMLGNGQSAGFNRQHLGELLGEHYPEAAIRFIKTGNFSGPIYNEYGWGGYLIWQLPDWPVSIDGRANLHGDERLRRYHDTWQAAPDWVKDPELAAAGLVITANDKPLLSLLKLDRRFTQVYADKVATVFAARQQPESSSR